MSLLANLHPAPSRGKNSKRSLKSVPPLLESSSKKKEVLEFPIRTRFEEVIKGLDRAKFYTIDQVASMAGVWPKTLREATKPRGSRPPRIASETILVGGKKRVLLSGSTAILILRALDSVPNPTCSAKEVGASIGIKGEAVVRNVFEEDGRKFYKYESPDGVNIIIPVYSSPLSKDLLFDACAPRVLKARSMKKERVSWDQALRILISHSIDVVELKLLLKDNWITRTGPQAVFSFPLLFGENFIMVGEITRTGKTDRSITFRREEVEQFALELKKEAAAWMSKKDLASLLGVAKIGGGTEKLSFTLDGQRFKINFTKRANMAYLPRVVAEAYLEWRRLQDHSLYTDLPMVYKSSSKGNTEKRRACLSATSSKIDGKPVFVLSPLYGIAIRIRECSGAKKVDNFGASVLRFYLNLQGGTRKLIREQLNALSREMENPTLATRVKFVVLRDFMVSSPVALKGSERFFHFGTVMEDIAELSKTSLWLAVFNPSLSFKASSESPFAEFEPPKATYLNLSD